MGLYSWLLLIGAVNGVVLAGLVLCGPGARTPRWLLAALIGLISLRLAPFILGYAGVYDVWPWLTFAPFDLSFAYGPLLWGYVFSLTHSRPPRRWGLHLAPAALQALYWIACFSLPLGAKWGWYTGPHLGIVAPVGAALGLLSVTLYLAVSWRTIEVYRRWLDSRFADRDEARLSWLTAMIVAFAIALLLAAAFAFTSWFITPLDYFDRFPLMIAFCLLTYSLGLLAWRHGAVAYPSAEEEADAPELPTTARDYAVQAEVWRARVVEAGWWRDENLDLAGLARRLNTSPRTLSRTLGEGLGQSFRAFLGQLRAEAAARILADPDNADDVLTIAFDVGFRSKASFNRAFQRTQGMAPTAWRRAARLKNRQSPNAAVAAATHPAV